MKRAHSNRTLRGCCRTCSRLLGICYFLLAIPAAAQGLIGFGKREEFVQFEAQGANMTSSTNRVVDLNSNQRRFNEQIGVRGDLYIVDRSFVTINFGSLFGFLQDHLDSNGQQGLDRGRLIGYDLGGNLDRKSVV